MPITWNPYLVALSIVVAIFGSFTALAHAKRMRESTGRGVVVWMIVGGFTLGQVIWTMHFIGMLAFHLPIPISYDLELTLLSGLPAVAAALLGFYLLRTKKLRLGQIVGGGLIMGLGITAMHYTGMAALKMSPPITYDPVIFFASVGIAVLAACGALLIVYAGEEFQLPPLAHHVLGGIVMGLAISGMHYTAMAGAHFPLGSVCLGDLSSIDPARLTLFVSVGVFFLLGAGFLANLLDQRKAVAERLRDDAARIQAILDTVADGIITINEYGDIETFNPAAERIFGYTAAEVVGRNINMFMPEPYYSQHEGYLGHYRATGEKRLIGCGREVMGRRKDGGTFPLELAVSEMQLGGGRFFTGIVRDITERRSIEEKLHTQSGEIVRKNVELEHASQMKSEFLATTGQSH